MRFQIDGLQDLRDALRRLPVELRDEAASVITEHADRAADEITTEYEAHTFTGHLAQHTYVSRRDPGPFGAGATVRNTSPHAWIFENGSQTRRSRSGNASPMPPGHVFIPIVIRHRRAMRGQLVAIVRRAGLQVTDDGR